MGMQLKLNGVGDVHQLFNGDTAVLEFEHGNEDKDRGGNGAVSGHRVGVAMGIAKGLYLELGNRVDYNKYGDVRCQWGCTGSRDRG